MRKLMVKHPWRCLLSKSILLAFVVVYTTGCASGIKSPYYDSIKDPCCQLIDPHAQTIAKMPYDNLQFLLDIRSETQNITFLHKQPFEVDGKPVYLLEHIDPTQAEATAGEAISIHDWHGLAKEPAFDELTVFPVYSLVEISDRNDLYGKRYIEFEMLQYNSPDDAIPILVFTKYQERPSSGTVAANDILVEPAMMVGHGVLYITLQALRVVFLVLGG